MKGFKMKGFQPHSGSPMMKAGPISWLKKTGKKAVDWFDENIVETFRTGKDPAERWVEQQQYNRLLDPRNKSEAAIKARKEYQARLKKNKNKKLTKK